jgi:uncharacterized MAPEG superfamily protein
VIPYAIYRIGKIGLLQVFLNPLPGDAPFDHAWAHRAYRAHMNSFENLTLFAPIALSVVIVDSGNATTALWAQVYFWARLVHWPMTITKAPFARTIAYFVGLYATLAMAWQVLF